MLPCRDSGPSIPLPCSWNGTFLSLGNILPLTITRSLLTIAWITGIGHHGRTPHCSSCPVEEGQSAGSTHSQSLQTMVSVMEIQGGSVEASLLVSPGSLKS